MTSIRVPDTISKLSPDDTYPVVEGSDVGGFADLKNEVNDNTSKIETNITNVKELQRAGQVFTFTGSTAPTYPASQRGNYLIVSRGITQDLAIQTPNPTGGMVDGAIFTIYNESDTYNITLTSGTSAEIDSATDAITIPPENYVSYVYRIKPDNYIELESGYIPTSKVNLANYLEQKFTADGKIHTEADLETAGFLKGIQVSGEKVTNVNDVKWIHFNGATVAQGKANQAEITVTGAVNPTESVLHFQTIAERNQWSSANGSKYSQVVCVVDADNNGFVAWFEWNGTKWTTYNAQGLIMSDSDGAIPKVIKTVVFGPDFAIQQAGDQEDAALITYTPAGGNGSLTIRESGTDDDIVGINELNLKGIKITETPNSGGMGATEAEITAGIDIHMPTAMGGQGSALANDIEIMPPLSVFMNPDQVGGEAVRLEIEHDAFEPMQAPSFLAYLTETEEVTGKLDIHGQPTGHPKGAVWFDDVICPAGAFIETDKINKAYGIQEADELDPNVSGGMNYLICYRMAFKGKAPNDGFVRIFLMEKRVGTQGSFKYLTDVNDHPLAVERFYKAGEELGHLDIIAVVNAKNLIEFQCLTEDSFTDDMLNIEDRENGASGLMIQALKSDDKTGRAFLQYMHDTGQDIIFNSHYLGVERMSIKWMTGFDQPLTAVSAGTDVTQADGISAYIIGNMMTGIQNGYMEFKDNGSDIADFNFGKIFSADETRMLRGRVVTVTATLVDKQDGYNIGLFKWTGKPDEFTDHIFSSRGGGGQIVLDTNWTETDKLFISEDVVSGDHTVTKDFTVPADANNYAVAIYPIEAQQPLHLKLKQFELDVKTPFIGFDIHAPVLASEKHLVFSDEHKQFTQDNQGYASLRYTINNEPTNGLPMPIGMDKGGNADIELDTTASIANVVGSGARGGEGCVKFKADGNARIVTNLKLWNETGQDTPVKFWWAEVSPDGNSVTKLPDSVFTCTVKAGAKGTHYAFGYDHDFEKNDRIALRSSADRADGAFLQATPSVKPLVSNYIEFKELKVADGGDDPWGTLDLSQFEHVYSHELDGRIVIRNASSATVNFEIEPHMYFDVKRAIKIDGNVARPVKSLDYSYNYDTHELKISLGETVTEARVLVGIYV